MTVSDGKYRPQLARLKVCPDFLALQREEFVFPDDDDDDEDEGADNVGNESVDTLDSKVF